MGRYLQEIYEEAACCAKEGDQGSLPKEHCFPTKSLFSRNNLMKITQLYNYKILPMAHDIWYDNSPISR